MKKVFGAIVASLLFSLSLNAKPIEEELMFSGCHTAVDYIMISAIEAGDYDGNMSGAIDDWNALYDLCDML